MFRSSSCSSGLVPITYRNMDGTQDTTETARIPVRKAGKTVAWAIVDADDAARLRQWPWSLTGRGYAMATPGLMHRVVLELAVGDPEVDHVNRRPLDNRRANLRLSTRVNNMRNSSVYDRAERDRKVIRDLWATGKTRHEIAAETSLSYGVVTKALTGMRREGPHHLLVWSRDSIADAFRRFHAEHGRVPTHADLNGRDGMPWFTLIYRQFDNMAAAREYAGFGAIDLRKRAA